MLVFIDFEASSLDSDSWPIEIGLSWIEPDGSVTSFGKLIRPGMRSAASRATDA